MPCIYLVPKRICSCPKFLLQVLHICSIGSFCCKNERAATRSQPPSWNFSPPNRLPPGRPLHLLHHWRIYRWFWPFPRPSASQMVATVGHRVTIVVLRLRLPWRRWSWSPPVPPGAIPRRLDDRLGLGIFQPLNRWILMKAIELNF